jgi:hypothetical protein
VLGTFIELRLPCTDIILRARTPEACLRREHTNRVSFEEMTDPTFLKLHAPAIQPSQVLQLIIGRAVCRARNITNQYEAWAYDEPILYDTNHLSMGISRRIGEVMRGIYRESLTEFGLHISPD